MDKEKKLIVANVIDTLNETFSGADLNTLLNQIEGHKYFLDKQLNISVTFEQAAFSWMENVYKPIALEMDNFLTIVSFSNKEKNQLFFELCDHQLLLSINSNKTIEAHYAVQNYCIQYGSSIGKFFSHFVKKTA
ncbi:MAG: DUF4032 domain-containing protein [Spirochaetaceae bacterium]|nr:DUF4032 domain-containing protein [Spirochaetaceae bacterium]